MITMVSPWLGCLPTPRLTPYSVRGMQRNDGCISEMSTGEPKHQYAMSKSRQDVSRLSNAAVYIYMYLIGVLKTDWIAFAQGTHEKGRMG